MRCSQGATPNCLSMSHLGGTVAAPPVLVWCDNLVVVSIIASQPSKDSLIMHLLSLAASSRKAYGSGQASYHLFCRKLNLAYLPASEDSLILFVAELSQQVSYSTIRSYLSAVRQLHISKGYRDPLANTPRLDLVLKGTKHLRPGAPDTRLPITPLILRRIKSTLL